MSHFAGMNVLITGATGTVGSALTERIKDEAAKVYCQSRSSHSPRGEERWVQCDLTEVERALSGLPEWDLVFHLAGQTSLPEARRDPLRALQDNVVGFVTLLEVLRKQNHPPMVVATGTVTQVGLPATTTIHERIADDPTTFYDVTKQAAELFLKQYVREGWLRGCYLRLATVYGASSSTQAADRGIIDKVVSAAREGRTGQIFGKGDYLRDYIHIEDVIEALMAAAAHAETVNGKAFVIGTGRGVTLKDAFTFAARYGAALGGHQPDVQNVDPPDSLSPIDFRSAVADSSAFREATGWEARYDLHSGLERTYGRSPIG